MPINIDNAEECAVTIKLSRNFPICREVDVFFSRSPDSEVLKELEVLCQRPGFKLFDYWSRYLHWRVECPRGWDGAKIAEAIAVCFEQEHGLKVARLISDPDSRDASPKKPVNSFVI